MRGLICPRMPPSMDNYILHFFCLRVLVVPEQGLLAHRSTDLVEISEYRNLVLLEVFDFPSSPIRGFIEFSIKRQCIHCPLYPCDTQRSCPFVAMRSSSRSHYTGHCKVMRSCSLFSSPFIN
jgi:hypothetical protein